jgi:hypothetical protein
MSTYTADDVLFGYQFNRLAFTVPTPSLTDNTQDPPVTGRFFCGNNGNSGVMLSSISFRFVSSVSQRLLISWGDGTFEQIQLSIGTISFARDAHEYTDGLDFHTIVFTFEKPKAITEISTGNFTLGEVIPEDLKKFTSLQKISFILRTGIKSFPEDLSSLTLLTELTVTDAEITKLDDSLFSLPLTVLNFDNSIDFSETVAGNSLARLAELVFLESLNFTDTNLTEFPANFINRNLLEALNISGNNPFTILPINIPISITSLNIQDKTNGELTSYQNFDRLVNLESVFLDGFENENVLIGDELASCVKLKYVEYKRASVGYQIGTDAIVNNWFNFMVTRGFSTITGDSSTPFRSMIFYLNEGSRLTNRPSGTYQAPTGFDKNVSNGTPANELEIIYCLVENYGHTWTVGDGITNGGEQTFLPS